MPIDGDSQDATVSSLNAARDPFAGRAVVLLVACFVLTAGAGLLSEGIYHEDDLKHFLFARWSRHDPRYLIDEWGRPGCTALHALPAMIGSATTGWHACRLLSAVLSAATAWLVYRIARRFRLRHAWLAIPLLYLQPLFAHLSLTTLTETPAAFYLALATWLLVTGRSTASGAAIAVALVTRHETIVIVPIWALALWRARAHWAAYGLMFWAPALYNLVAAVHVHWLPVQVFFAPDGATQYGSGTPLTYVPRLLFAAGPAVLALAVMGGRRLIRRSNGWVVAAAAAIYFITETVIYMRGAYSSGGYARFLVPIAPWLALLATTGVQPVLLARRPAIRLRVVVACGITVITLWLLCEIEWWWRPPTIPQKWQLAASAGRIAAACFVVLLAAALYRIRHTGGENRKTLSRRLVTIAAAGLLLALPIWAIMPLKLLPQHEIMRDAANTIEARGWHRRRLISVNYWLYYWTDRWVPNDVPLWRDALAQADPGTIFAWDARFCLDPDFNFPLEEMSANKNWQPIWTSGPDGDGDAPFLVLFERQSPPASTGAFTSQ